MTTVAEFRRMADVQEHYERGGYIQMRRRDTLGNDWSPPVKKGFTVCCLSWDLWDYRIAPEPRKARECWRWEYEDGRLSAYAYPTEDQCRGSAGVGRPVRFMEAMDEPAKEKIR